jgi:hypothetical protein
VLAELRTEVSPSLSCQGGHLYAGNQEAIGDSKFTPLGEKLFLSNSKVKLLNYFDVLNVNEQICRNVF